MSIYCSNCGTQLRETASFCPICGKAVKNTSANNENPVVKTETATAVKKQKKQKKQKKSHVKSIIAAALAAVIFVGTGTVLVKRFSPVSAAASDYTDLDYIDEGLDSASYVEELLAFTNKKAYYEFSDEELNSAIDRITAIKYNNKFDLKKIYDEEIESIKADGCYSIEDKYSSEKFECSWFVNGKVDKDTLYSKIIENTENAGYPVDDKIKRYAKATASAVSDDIEFIKKTYPDFNIDSKMSKFNDIKIALIDEEEAMASYGRDGSVISFNPENIPDDLALYITAGHEVFHLIIERYVQYDIMDSQGASLNILTNGSDPLNFDFMSERYVDGMSYEAMGLEDVINYDEQNEKIEMIANATGKPVSYFRDNYIYNNSEALINAFEPEMQDFMTAFSCYTYANYSCGMGCIDCEHPDDELRIESFENFRLLLLKNAYIRELKSCCNGEESLDEALENLQLTVDMLRCPLYDCSTDNVFFENTVAQLDEIIRSF